MGVLPQELLRWTMGIQMSSSRREQNVSANDREMLLSLNQEDNKLREDIARNNNSCFETPTNTKSETTILPQVHKYRQQQQQYELGNIPRELFMVESSITSDGSISPSRSDDLPCRCGNDVVPCPFQLTDMRIRRSNPVPIRRSKTTPCGFYSRLDDGVAASDQHDENNDDSQYLEMMYERHTWEMYWRIKKARERKMSSCPCCQGKRISSSNDSMATVGIHEEAENRFPNRECEMTQCSCSSGHEMMFPLEM